MSHAHTHTHVPRTLGACDLTHMRVAYAQNPGSMFAHAHMCVAEARKPWGRGHTSGCLVAHAAFALMFECVTSQRCVLPTRADMCVVEGGAVMTWLHVVSSHASPHTHTRTRAHVCGASREPRPWSLTCAHTHTCVLQTQGVRGHASSCLFWLHMHATARVWQKQGAEATTSQAVLL